MPLSVLQPYNIPRMPSRPQRPLPPQKEPGPWDKFAESAGQGLGESIQGQIADRLEASALERALGGVNPNASPLEQQLDLARRGIGPTQRANVSAITKPMHEARGKQAEQEFELQKLRQQGEQNKELEAYKHQVTPKKGELPPEQKAHLQQTFNKIATLAKSGNYGVEHPLIGGLNPIREAFSPARRRAKAEINTMNLELMGLTRNLENQGHLTERQADDIRNRLLKPTDTEEEIEGKLLGFAQITGLDPSVLGIQNAQLQVGQQLDQLPATAPKNATAEDGNGNKFIFNGTDWQRMG